MKILHVAGARPNFMKVAPIIAAMQRHGEAFTQFLVHTGQHYDYQMSKIFFDDLDLPEPDEHLEVGSGTHAEQTARILLAFEPVVDRYRPDWVFVVGDVNSTLACALVCAKMGVRVAHVEAGLRSFDRSMPEEINRLLTDRIADLLFTPSLDGDQNLINEGVDPAKIHRVGNVMIDTLIRLLPQARRRLICTELGLDPGGYILVTLHRPANVDTPEVLAEILTGLAELAKKRRVIFPVHPRTRTRMQSFGPDVSAVEFLEPLGYLDFLALEDGAGLVVTDSGGLQEETTYLGVPCLTVRSTTERPVTVSEGTNRLVAATRQAILAAAGEIEGRPRLAARVPELWDGLAAGRIAEIMLRLAEHEAAAPDPSTASSGV